jgi:tRNA threonylcarbamoyl adenosine modification protein YeaZ
VVEIDTITGRARQVVASSVVDARRHGEVLAPSMRSLLDQAGLTPGGLSAVVAGVGPGPYTSLRVGVVTAVALAQALGVPAHGVCSLDGVPPPLAQAPTTWAPTTWAAVTDARRREVFWALYDGSRRTSGPFVGVPARVGDELRARSVTWAVGPGVVAYPSAFEGLAVPGAPPAYPDPALLVERVLPELVGNLPASPLVPIYLRRPDATEPRRPSAVVG